MERLRVDAPPVPPKAPPPTDEPSPAQSALGFCLAGAEAMLARGEGKAEAPGDRFPRLRAWLVGEGSREANGSSGADEELHLSGSVRESP